MAAVLDLDSINNADTKAELHMMPCKIQHNSKANIAQYFYPSVAEQEGGLTASFRGRPLNGHEVSVPSEYIGLVLREPHRPFDEEDEREVKVTHTFEKFTHWNLDRPSSENDCLRKALHWINLSKAVHGSITEESSQNSVTGK